MWHAGMFVSDTQLRRARALFPCLDSPLSCHTFEFEVTVPVGQIAVCSGWLVSQTVRVVSDDRGAGAGGSVGNGMAGGQNASDGSSGLGCSQYATTAAGMQRTQTRTFKYEVSCSPLLTTS